MATKSTKSKGKKSTSKIRDLSARKNPKGGAQKKETQGETGSMRRGGATNRGVRNLN